MNHFRIIEFIHQLNAFFECFTKIWTVTIPTITERFTMEQIIVSLRDNILVTPTFCNSHKTQLPTIPVI